MRNFNIKKLNYLLPMHTHIKLLHITQIKRLWYAVYIILHRVFSYTLLKLVGLLYFLTEGLLLCPSLPHPMMAVTINFAHRVTDQPHKVNDQPHEVTD